jgi:UDP-N-acetylglucosamine--dolichyl-phosphate N-acetylglucosaminephosphotransferase
MIPNIFLFLFLLFSFLFSFLISFFLVKKFIKIISKTNYLGKDMNKIDRPFVCELGGLPVFLSFIITLLFLFLIDYILYLNFNFVFLNFIEFILIILTIFLIFIIGFVDDILGWKKGISQIQHFIIPIIFSIPMVIYGILYNLNNLYIPLIGNLNVNLIYPFILIPIAITATTNAVNLLAGYNGFEAGIAIIIFLTISVFSLFLGNFTLLVILFSWLAALLGFLVYNKFPSKIFPGDIITLINGALIGISAIVLKLEILIAFLIILFIIEFVIKAKHKFKTECFGIIQKNGIIKPNPKKGSLIHFILSKGKFTEKKLVFIFYIIQGIISIVSIFLFFIIYL